MSNDILKIVAFVLHSPPTNPTTQERSRDLSRAMLFLSEVVQLAKGHHRSEADGDAYSTFSCEEAMNEKEAREILKKFGRGDEYQDDDLVNWAKGYLAGLEAERERAKPLVEEIRNHHVWINYGNDRAIHAKPCRACKVLAAYENREAMVDSPPSTINHENREKP